MRSKLSNNFLQIICLVTIFFTFGCVTPTKKDPAKKKQPTEVIKNKPGTKGSPSNNQAVAKPELPPIPTTDQQLNFFRSHVNSESAFGDEDIYFLSTIPKGPETGSVSEAVLTIGILKSVINPLVNTIKPSFEEQDLDTQKSAPVSAKPADSNAPTIEKLFKEQKIDLADALAENPLLGSWPVASMVRQALVAGSDTPDYQNEIVNILKRTAAKWSQLNQGLGGKDISAEVPPHEPKMMTDTYGNVYDANTPTNGDDSTIAEAQKLADSGKWQDAIKTASSVGKDHPSYPLAQERIKDYSNKAVQVLRKKAAAAFQSAIPITDVKTRAQYLRQAKTYLEDAIKNYPQASQLPTVRDNLRVISRDLDQLETEAGG
jgi:hypothetical protein